MGKLIALIGNTGVGKTSLARALAARGEFILGLEDHNTRPFQALFKNDSRFALANQVDYFLLRAEQERTLRQIPQVGIVDGGLDQDFHGFTRLFHSRAFLGNPEFEICQRLYEFIRSQLPPPDLIIYLSASIHVIQQRLAGRSRINIASSDDLALLDQNLADWVATLSPDRVLKVDISNASPAYDETIPILTGKIRDRLALDAGTYETGYTP